MVTEKNLCIRACFRKLDKCLSNRMYLPQQRICKRVRYPQKRCGISRETFETEGHKSPLYGRDICAASAGKNVARQKAHHQSAGFITTEVRNTLEYSRMYENTTLSVLTPFERENASLPPEVTELRTSLNYDC